MNRNKILSELEQKIREMKQNDRSLSEDDYIDYKGAGLNSLEVLTLIVFIEETYDFELDDEELELDKFVYLKDFIDLIVKKAEGKNEESI